MNEITSTDRSIREAQYVRRNRLLHLSDLFTNSDVQLDLVTNEDRETLAAEIFSHRADVAPADETVIMSSLTQTVALLGANVSEGNKNLWFTAAGLELLELPGRLALAGLASARRKCTRLSDVIPHVFEEWSASAKSRTDHLRTLENLAAKIGLEV